MERAAVRDDQAPCTYGGFGAVAAAAQGALSAEVINTV